MWSLRLNDELWRSLAAKPGFYQNQMATSALMVCFTDPAGEIYMLYLGLQSLTYTYISRSVGPSVLPLGRTATQHIL